ncbi:PadR family transcriptional regulator [Spongiactinospora rosea]|uniref:PadR family transcriptional regulator n=1 Tax=Spongiactinospora rosea TaxID=2248750 RepID=A0A366LZN3_9ACTN|nr:PadR family transcriptional regulator [Spongiactinospora rosea]RBQ19227.1 PadR family transcriptional regulator [Spongiactinospora rosea]
MSTRRKVSNLLGLAVLGLLLERPMHPHAMAAEFRERGLDHAFKLTTGSLYDTVNALVRAEWISAVEVTRSGNRPERTVYAHTPVGRQEFLRWLDELLRTPAQEYPRFVSAVTYLGALGKTGAREALLARSAALRTLIDDARRAHADVLDGGRAPRLFVIEVEYAVRMYEAELGWVEEIIADIETGALEWPQAVATEAGELRG